MSNLHRPLEFQSPTALVLSHTFVADHQDRILPSLEAERKDRFWSGSLVFHMIHLESGLLSVLLGYG